MDHKKQKKAGSLTRRQKAEQKRPFLLLVFLGLSIMTLGTMGYMAVEKWRLIDSLYMTIITMSTVGYMEVHPLSPQGRVFTVFLILVGVATFFYAGGVFLQFMVEGRIRRVLGRRKLEKSIEKLEGHYIVCGFGRIGRVLCSRLSQGPVDIVVIDHDERAIRQLDKEGYLYVAGEATDEESLEKAGIARAKGLIAALGTDTDNVFVVLTARQLREDLFIMARANEWTSTKKLLAAGSSKVISPYDIAAQRMAQGILRPTVTDFLDLTMGYGKKDIQMEEIPMSTGSRLHGVTLAESHIRRDMDLIVISIKRPNGEMIFNPSYDSRIFAGDTVIVVGERQNLEKLEAVLNP
ncbi:MAG: potassium channel protein [Deltaproteobacteria bacterium]|nr:potassium channel protein [Deltaproteobacteria bacterium]